MVGLNRFGLVLVPVALVKEHQSCKIRILAWVLVWMRMPSFPLLRMLRFPLLFRLTISLIIRVVAGLSSTQRSQSPTNFCVCLTCYYCEICSGDDSVHFISPPCTSSSPSSCQRSTKPDVNHTNTLLRHKGTRQEKGQHDSCHALLQVTN